MGSEILGIDGGNVEQSSRAVDGFYLGSRIHSIQWLTVYQGMRKKKALELILSASLSACILGNLQKRGFLLLRKMSLS